MVMRDRLHPIDITREPPASCPCGGSGEHVADGETVRCGCDLLRAAKLLRTHGYAVAPPPISVRIIAALRALGRCSVAELSPMAYGSSSPENRNRMRSLLAQLALQNRVRQVAPGQWEACEEGERKPRRRYRSRLQRAGQGQGAPPHNMREVA